LDPPKRRCAGVVGAAAPVSAEGRTGRLLQIMGPAGEDGLGLAQDARVLVARLPQGSRVRHEVGEGRGGYLYVLDGELEAAGEQLGGGDAAKLAGPEALELAGVNDAELILIDVPLRFQPVGVGTGRLIAVPAWARPAPWKGRPRQAKPQVVASTACHLHL
jgi:Quercetinase C-terminal cupin domain